MRRRTRICLFLATVPIVVPAIMFLSVGARAQTSGTTTTTTAVATSTNTPTVASVANQPDPLHVVNGQVVAQRPVNLTPLGVNYQDCINNMVLQFSVEVSGFDGTTNSLQVWATKSGDCTSQTTRGLSGSAANTCWLVNQGATLPNYETPQTVQFNVRVQDLVGPQQSPPFGSVLVHEGASACTAQPSFAAVPMDIWFLALDSSGNSNGSPFDYKISTDLVGPPAPGLTKPGIGDTLLIANWTPNTDGDTGGYNIFVDPIPGMESMRVGSDATVASSTQEVCPDSGSSISTSGEAGMTDAETGDGATDASASVDATASSDAGCRLVSVGGSPNTTNSTTMCASDPVLMSSIVQDGGTVETSDALLTEPLEEASVIPVEEGGIVEEGSGGISTIPTAYLVNPNPGTHLTVSGETDSTYIVKGLKNGTLYNYVVASVDNSGNIGPPSTQGCATPAPVDDFWKVYRQDGGQAGGGFCALEAAGAPAGSTIAFGTFGALIAAAVRRRRSSASSRTDKPRASSRTAKRKAQ